MSCQKSNRRCKKGRFFLDYTSVRWGIFTWPRVGDFSWPKGALLLMQCGGGIVRQLERCLAEAAQIIDPEHDDLRVYALPLRGSMHAWERRRRPMAFCWAPPQLFREAIRLHVRAQPSSSPCQILTVHVRSNGRDGLGI